MVTSGAQYLYTVTDVPYRTFCSLKFFSFSSFRVVANAYIIILDAYCTFMCIFGNYIGLVCAMHILTYARTCGLRSSINLIAPQRTLSACVSFEKRRRGRPNTATLDNGIKPETKKGVCPRWDRVHVLTGVSSAIHDGLDRDGYPCL